MRMEDPSINPELALCWALAAKNSLENYQGFSPAQLVFGENPKMPALYSAGPPGLEKVQVSKAAAAHISALHLAREAFIQCEADRVLRTALRQRVYARGEDVMPGDWIYFKSKTRRWEGPVKVTSKDGKLLYVVRAGRLMTINSDHAELANTSDEVINSNEATTGIQDVRKEGLVVEEENPTLGGSEIERGDEESVEEAESHTALSPPTFSGTQSSHPTTVCETISLDESATEDAEPVTCSTSSSTETAAGPETVLEIVL